MLPQWFFLIFLAPQNMNMKKVYSLLMAVVLTASLFAQPCHKLFFSEYVEGSGSNKALEIYNPTSAPVSLFGYKLQIYSNGATTAGTNYSLNGIIAPGDVYVIANNAADSVRIRPLADTLSGGINFNGNDAVALIYGTDTIDVFGIRGNNPGNNTGWLVDTTRTFDHTFIRKSTVNQGYSTWDTAQWYALPKDTVRLGAHTGPTGLAACSVSAQDTVAIFAPTSGSFTGVNGNYSLRVELSLPHTDSLTLDVALASGNAAWVNNYTTQTLGFGSGVTVRNLSVTITNDTAGGATNVLTFKLVNPSTGLVVGADSVFTLTLLPPPVAATDTCATLFFSEYLEGSASNKALEIYNPTASAVDFTGYKIVVFANGNTTPSSSFNLSGTLAAGDVYVIIGSQSDSLLKPLADTLTGTVTNYNGNDAIALLYGTDTLDVIGIVGNDPGAGGWTAGDSTTTNHTLVRAASVKKGNTNWAIASTTWTALRIDSNQLGSHTGPTNQNACALTPLPNGINETVADNIGRIYPNPNNGNFVVELNNLNNSAEVKLFDLTGRMVYSTKENTAKMNISVNNLTTGMYVVEVKTGNLVSRTKITVQQ